MPLSPPDAFEYARRAVETWTGLGALSPEVAVIVAAFEKASGPLAQVVMQGYGSVEIQVRDRNKTRVEWRQVTLWS